MPHGLLLYHLFHSLLCTIDVPMYTAGKSGLAHVFNSKLFFTRDIMDDDADPKHFNVPEPKPKPKPKPPPKPNAAPKPGPKGQHRQEFRMVYHRKKGFTFEPVEH